MPAATSAHSWASPRHRNAVHWVVAIAALALVFDGYDLVVYGTVLPILMQDAGQLGEISAAQAGALGSYALVGVMVGALVTGALGDHLGRRKMMLVNIAWFSIGMGAAAMSTNITMFGLLRFFTGIGVGGLVATAGADRRRIRPARQAQPVQRDRLQRCPRRRCAGVAARHRPARPRRLARTVLDGRAADRIPAAAGDREAS